MNRSKTILSVGILCLGAGLSPAKSWSTTGFFDPALERRCADLLRNGEAELSQIVHTHLGRPLRELVPLQTPWKKWPEFSAQDVQKLKQDLPAAFQDRPPSTQEHTLSRDQNSFSSSKAWQMSMADTEEMLTYLRQPLILRWMDALQEYIDQVHNQEQGPALEQSRNLHDALWVILPIIDQRFHTRFTVQFGFEVLRSLEPPSELKRSSFYACLLKLIIEASISDQYQNRERATIRTLIDEIYASPSFWIFSRSFNFGGQLLSIYKASSRIAPHLRPDPKKLAAIVLARIYLFGFTRMHRGTFGHMTQTRIASVAASEAYIYFKQVNEPRFANLFADIYRKLYPLVTPPRQLVSDPVQALDRYFDSSPSTSPVNAPLEKSSESET